MLGLVAKAIDGAPGFVPPSRRSLGRSRPLLRPADGPVPERRSEGATDAAKGTIYSGARAVPQIP